MQIIYQKFGYKKAPA